MPMLVPLMLHIVMVSTVPTQRASNNAVEQILYEHQLGSEPHMAALEATLLQTTKEFVH